MRRLLVLFVFGGAASACASAPLSPSLARARATPQVPERAPAPAAHVTACRAVPSTIYGDAAVVFEVDGTSVGALAEAELLDERGRRVAFGPVQVPGKFRPGPLPSGDFRLQVGLNHASCAVTVNRELSRATEAVR